jgi:hypothetical protein
VRLELPVNRGSLTRSLVLLIVACGSGCAASGQALFAMTASSCGRNSDECRAYCQEQRDSSACDVSKVLFAEEIIAKRGKGYEPFQVSGALKEVTALCKSDSIGRACKAASDLEPLSAGTTQATRERLDLARRLDVARARGRAAQQELHQRRFGGAAAVGSSDGREGEARDAESTLNAESETVTALLRKDTSPAELEPHVAAVEQAADALDAAVARTRDGNAEAERARAAVRGSEVAQKQAAAAKIAAYDAGFKLCEAKEDGTIPGVCLADCERDPAAWSCIALASNYEAVSVAKARPIYKRSCDAGNEQGCDQLRKMESGEAARKQAEQDIPRLTAKCQAVVGRVHTMKAEVRAAVTAKSRERMADLQAKYAGIGTENSQALNDLQSAIWTATGGEGARYQQLLLAAQKACTP